MTSQQWTRGATFLVVFLALALSACDDGGGDGASCSNGQPDGEETDVDCGGTVCGPCAVGQRCRINIDCTSGNCDHGYCRPEGETCRDGVHNGDETDVDCGWRCDPCDDGMSCERDGDCESRSCVDGVCVNTSCSNEQQDEEETDVDCGGPVCAPCADGLVCVEGTDCESGICTDGVCTSCTDEAQNGNETDVDCGGPDCGACEDGKACVESSDCISALCDEGVCVSCFDEAQNGPETDVDCGGPLCEPCDVGEGCTEASDCVTGSCRDGTCAAPACDDEEMNGEETDVDCGGPDCDPCADGASCAENGDCASERCVEEVCISCSDGVTNGTETDVDCGGPDCGPCTVGATCTDGRDCLSGVCGEDDTCQPSCDDGLLDGDETDVDCGGPDCDPCGEGQSCDAPTDCISGICLGDRCQPSCEDGVRDGDETGTDCGGGECPACPGGEGCEEDSDCLSMICSDGVCLGAGCTDELQNGDETDVDCGGPECEPCADGQTCVEHIDCASELCDDGICISCSDGVLNGDESDVDCGGADCDPCPEGSLCREASDCESEVCHDDGRCGGDCSDGILDGLETDVDCGGGVCPACEDGQTCDRPEDCLSLVCTDRVCQVPSCGDRVANGEETDVDCGGPDCDPCEFGRGCAESSDCVAEAICLDETCALPRSCAQILSERPDTESGAALIDPDLDGPVPTSEVYCDMETDEGGWTLVGSTLADPLRDQGSMYYPELATLNPERPNQGIWTGLRTLAVTPGDLRFTCRRDDEAVAMTVDMSFYEVDWYNIVTAVSDAESCFFPGACGGRETPSPARRDNLRGLSLGLGDTWEGGCLVGEDSCDDMFDFTIDFDDQGIGGDESDGTDWGAANGTNLCGGPVVHTTGQWFLWFREDPAVYRCSNGEQDGDETDVDCGGSCAGCGLERACAESSDCEAGLVCIDEVCSNPTSCLAIAMMDDTVPSGPYSVDPDGAGPEEPRVVYCDMETDEGGWTLVGASRMVPLNDQASRYYDDLATLNPFDSHGGIWNGLRAVIDEESDIRFSCQAVAGDPFDVDLIFYAVDWYLVVTEGADAESCFNVPGTEGTPPERYNVLTETLLPEGDGWNATGGLLIGEDECGAIDDFTVDFDDRGMNGDEGDGTDWGLDDGEAKCGAGLAMGGAWFVWVREIPE